MELKPYLRTIVNNKIRCLFIKNNCEICNTSKELQLHHVKHFDLLITETLHSLDLELKDTNDYVEEELSLIVDVVLGKHLRIEYITVCSNCHKGLHTLDGKVQYWANNKEYYEIQRMKKVRQRDLYIPNVLIPYLESIVNKKILKEDKKELIDKINLRDDRGRL